MSHAEGGKLKVVQFWRMRAAGDPARKLMDDVTAVKWLPLQQAIDTLTRRARKGISHERGPGGAAGRRTVRAEYRRRACGTAGPDDGGLPKPNTFFEAIRARLRRMAGKGAVNAGRDPHFSSGVWTVGQASASGGGLSR